MAQAEKTIPFDELSKSSLIVDAVYEGGYWKDVRDDPINVLLPGTGNQGGFRIARKKSEPSKYAYVVIYSSGEELEWPDEIDLRTGLFRYYGDNRKPGNGLHETKHKGNQMLEETFAAFHEGRLEDVPPFFVFRKTGQGRNVRFLGLAAPGHKNISTADDLVASWYMLNGRRFQNLRASFTLLELDDGVISREWIESLRTGDGQETELAPSCWREFAEHGRSALDSYNLHVIDSVPSKESQLPRANSDGAKLLQKIYERYTGKDNPFGFEQCASAIVQLMDNRFIEIELTRPWRDGGRDALGYYAIGPVDHPLKIACAIEAKCYEPSHGAGVKETSRLISRIKHREFGVFVCTSYIANQAYREILEDGHPILVITGKDISEILIKHGITESTVGEWLDELER